MFSKLPEPKLSPIQKSTFLEAELGRVEDLVLACSSLVNRTSEAITNSINSNLSLQLQIQVLIKENQELNARLKKIYAEKNGRNPLVG